MVRADGGSWRGRSPAGVMLCGDIRIGPAEMTQPGRVFALEAQRLGIVALEKSDEQGQREEAMRPELEQLDVVVAGESFSFGVREREPGAALPPGAVKDKGRALSHPQGNGA